MVRSVFSRYKKRRFLIGEKNVKQPEINGMQWKIIKRHILESYNFQFQVEIKNIVFLFMNRIFTQNEIFHNKRN